MAFVVEMVHEEIVRTSRFASVVGRIGEETIRTTSYTLSCIGVGEKATRTIVSASATCCCSSCEVTKLAIRACVGASVSQIVSVRVG